MWIYYSSQGNSMLGSEFLVSGDLISESFLSGLESSLLGIVDFLVSSFFTVG